jgi:hypothetical protein
MEGIHEVRAAVNPANRKAEEVDLATGMFDIAPDRRLPQNQSVCGISSSS